MEYSSQPRAAPIPGANGKTRSKFRESDTDPSSAGVLMAGLMTDPRVMKGSSYANPGATKGGSIKPQNSQTLSSTVGVPKRKQQRKWIESRAPTPPPPEGRTHCVLQTDEYIEVLFASTGSTSQTQTNAFHDRPSDPLFNRVKLGLDFESQIDSSDIFSFDIEVKPVLEVLMNSTLHGAMLELLQEEELEAIERERAVHEIARNAELAEAQRLEQEKRRVFDEKQRRIEQTNRHAREQAELEERLAARKVANEALIGLKELAFRTMESAGIFYCPVEHEVDELFMPSLTQSVCLSMTAYASACELLDELLVGAMAKARDFEAEVAIHERGRIHALQDMNEAKICTKLSAIFSMVDFQGKGYVDMASLSDAIRCNGIIAEEIGIFSPIPDSSSTGIGREGVLLEFIIELLTPFIEEMVHISEAGPLELISDATVPMNSAAGAGAEPAESTDMIQPSIPINADDMIDHDISQSPPDDVNGGDVPTEMAADEPIVPVSNVVELPETVLVVTRLSFIQALLPHLVSLSPPTSTSKTSLLPVDFPLPPLSTEFVARLVSYDESRCALPTPASLAPTFVATAKDSGPHVDAHGLICALCDDLPRDRSFWLNHIRTSPSFAALLKVPTDVCSLPQEAFDTIFVSFAPNQVSEEGVETPLMVDAASLVTFMDGMVFTQPAAVEE